MDDPKHVFLRGEVTLTEEGVDENRATFDVVTKDGLTAGQLLAAMLKSAVQCWPDEGPVPASAQETPWRAICTMAGGDTPACYVASSRFGRIVAAARRESGRTGRSWKQCIQYPEED